MIDLMFCAKGRPEFTRESNIALRVNTPMADVWLTVCHDGATPPEFDIGWAQNLVQAWRGPARFDRGNHGGPVGCLLASLAEKGSEIICKIDNDVIVPPGWLEQCLATMEAHPELDLLGIEPWQSRTANPQTGNRGDEPDHLDDEMLAVKSDLEWRPTYARTKSIGGIGLFRRRAFDRFPDLRAEGTYGGFTSWQLRHPELVIGWAVPPLKLFLLDRLPMDPWKSLSRRYIAEGVQRAWTDYTPEVAQELAGWWLNAASR